MPQYIDEFLSWRVKTRHKYFQYQKLDVTCKYFYEDGTKLTAYADKEKFEKEITTHTGESADALQKQVPQTARRSMG
jgi:hypothetical protein